MDFSLRMLIIVIVIMLCMRSYLTFPQCSSILASDVSCYTTNVAFGECNEQCGVGEKRGRALCRSIIPKASYYRDRYCIGEVIQACEGYVCKPTITGPTPQTVNAADVVTLTCAMPSNLFPLTQFSFMKNSQVIVRDPDGSSSHVFTALPGDDRAQFQCTATIPDQVSQSSDPYILSFALQPPQVLDCERTDNTLFFNEFHFNNQGDEFIEIAGTAGTNLARFTLYLFNSAGSLAVAGLSGVLSDAGNGIGFVLVTFSALTDGVRTGFMLLDNTDLSVVEFLSYGGSVSTTDFPVPNEISIDIDVTESAQIGNSIQRQGNGCNGDDFTWTGSIPKTPGNVNQDQHFEQAS